MRGYHGNIEELAVNNSNFRQVLYTSQHAQLVLMCLKPGEQIGEETHTTNDQFFRFESGTGKVVIDGNEYLVAEGSAVIVPQGAKHNVINTSDDKTLQLYTLYMPPHHKDGIMRATKDLAAADAPEFDGVTTE